MSAPFKSYRFGSVEVYEDTYGHWRVMRGSEVLNGSFTWPGIAFKFGAMAGRLSDAEWQEICQQALVGLNAACPDPQKVAAE